MGPLVGVRDVAAHLAGAGGGQRGGGGERRRGGVSRLDLEAAVVDRPAVETGRGARLEAPHPERERTELLGEGIGRRVPGPSALVAAEPDVDPPPEKRPRGQHHRAGAKGKAHAGRDPGHPAAARPLLQHEIVHRLLEQREAGLRLERAADLHPVALAIDLGPGRSHRRAAARVQGAEMDAGAIRGPPHGAPERVDLPDEMPLADPPDGGIAAHLAEGLDALGEEQGAGAGARRSEGRFGSGVPPSHDDDVEYLQVVHRGTAFRSTCARPAAARPAGPARGARRRFEPAQSAAAEASIVLSTITGVSKYVIRGSAP